MPPVTVATSRSIHSLETGEAKLWLLLVGVNQYQDERLPALRYSAVDCQGLAEALTDATSGFPQKEVLVYHDFAHQSPTWENVRKSLGEIVAVAKPQDTILFYFSGHGMLEPVTQEAVLCLKDTQTDNLLQAGLVLQDLLQLLATSAAQTQFVLLDACHSGGMTLLQSKLGAKVKIKKPSNPTPLMVELLRQRAKKSKGFYALLSCDIEQQSWEFPELGHGVFTYFLMRGLRGEAADAEGVIDADGLYRYVYRQTVQYIEHTNQQLRLINQQSRSRGESKFYSEYPLQTPKRIVEGVGELIIGLKPTRQELFYLRRALVVEGLNSNKATLAFSKALQGLGGFELDYFPHPEKNTLKDLHKCIQECLQTNSEHISTNLGTLSTVLFYLHGRIEPQKDEDAFLVIGEDIRLSREWLKKQLQYSPFVQQIIILDCPGEKQDSFLRDWVEYLQLDPEQGQCLIAYASPNDSCEKFLYSLQDTLTDTRQLSGLSTAAWIYQLQQAMQGVSQVSSLHIWLSGAKGVIDIIPPYNAHKHSQRKTAIDLGICPYRGLRAFQPEDYQYYYGRDELTKTLVSHVVSQPFLAVVGASGSGKSSLVQAGLIAQLRQGKQITGSNNWWIRSLRPGAKPLEVLLRLFANLPDSGETGVLEGMLYQGVEGFVYWLRQRHEPMIVLVIDQFEELLTLANAVDRERFLELVLGALELASDKFKLVITLRADFIAPCLEIPSLAKFLQAKSVLVPPCLTEEEYRQVIVQPAEQVGLTVEPELIEVLLQELHNSPGDLPLLEFVLEQLWLYRSEGELTLQAYQQHLGGIKGALERKAEDVYNNLNSLSKECARWIFLSLTQLGEGTEDTRRRVLKSELIVKKYPVELVENTLASLTAAKLVVVNLEEDETILPKCRDTTCRVPTPSPITVEVAHEVLIRHWSTLRWWLEENRARLRSQRQIEQAASLWKCNREQADFLLQGVRLAEAEDIYINYTDELSSDVQEFIEACLQQRNLQQQQEKNRLRQAQRTAVITSILGLAAFGFAGLAYQQSQGALLKEIQALNSLSENYLFSNKQLESVVTSLRAARELQGIKFYHVPGSIKFQTVSNLQKALDETQERNRLLGHNSWVSDVVYSPDGEMLASASTDSTIKLWRRDGSLITTLKAHGDGVNNVNFSPDGNTIISASADKTIKLWNRQGKLLATFSGHSKGVNSASFSPDGNIIISASDDNTVKVWSREGRLLQTLLGHSRGVNIASFSMDGNIIASGSDDGTIKLWSREGQLLSTLLGHQDEVLTLAWSKDGSKIVSGSTDHTVKIWSREGKFVSNFIDNKSGVGRVTFSPDGKILAVVGFNRNIQFFSLDGEFLSSFEGHTHGVNSVIFSPDGRTIASSSDDQTVRLWNLNIILPKTLFAHTDRVTGVAFTGNGQRVLSVGADKTLRVWNLYGELLETYTSAVDNVTNAAINFDKQIAAIALIDNTIHIGKLDGSSLQSLGSHDSYILNMTFSPDGNVFGTASADKTAKIWSKDGGLLHTLTGHNGWVTRVVFSRDGNLIATASADKIIKLWNRQGALLKTIQANNSSIWGLSFSPDSKIIASGNQDGTIHLWNLDGKLLKSFTGHTDAVLNINFSPNGKMLVSASDDRTVKLWSVESGSLLQNFQGYNNSPTMAAFSPDGKILATSSGDKTVKLWSLDGIKLQSLALNDLLKRTCSQVRDYLQSNTNISSQERLFCQGMGNGE